MQYKFRFFPRSPTDLDMTLNPINKDDANITATHNGDGNIYSCKKIQTFISRTCWHLCDFNAIYDDEYGGHMQVEVAYGHVLFR